MREKVLFEFVSFILSFPKVIIGENSWVSKSWCFSKFKAISLVSDWILIYNNEILLKNIFLIKFRTLYFFAIIPIRI
ncbi:unnamed protein product [Blepharisma stoltei]|uniref:Uncharacterized protein n=1 Tax=Blepharisma stoltei TaxID=1481888 RepID=A0AAU9JPG1_9CILI|nr:unnamed protein product [Blepharisma stoltei]